MTRDALLTRLGGVDVLTWNPLRQVEGEPGSRLTNNFGDLLGPLLVERILNALNIPTIDRTPRASPTLVSVGSIMHFAPRNAVVWGTGVNFKLARMLPTALKSLDVRAVRGPYSARALTAGGGSAPNVFGDPALLLPRYMPELKQWSSRGDGGVLVAPNLNDYEAMAHEAKSKGYAVLDPRGPVTGVLRTIAESGMVVGSSLHAVVIADALGIPARFVRSPAEGPLKYRDYLAGSGRPFAALAADLGEALNFGGHATPDVDLDALHDSFPRDLWGRANPDVERGEFHERPSIIAAWQDVLAGSRFEEQTGNRTFTSEIFPAAVRAARAALEATTPEAARVSRGEFEERFADAYGYRTAFAPQLGPECSARVPLEQLQALDSGDPSKFLRMVWLDREGPHAVLRETRSGHGMTTLAVAFRPGALSNRLRTITMCHSGSNNQVQVVTVPVFQMYARQWSIDVCATFALPEGAKTTSLTVRGTDDDGATLEVPVLWTSRSQHEMSAYPSLANTMVWQGQELQPDAASEDGTDNA